jgi:hypothetical protein
VPVQRFRDLDEARRALWSATDAATLSARIRRLWHFTGRLAKPTVLRGVRRFRTIEEANAERDARVTRRIRALLAERAALPPDAKNTGSWSRNERRPRPRRFLAIAGMVLALASPAVGNDEWLETMRAKHWVTAFVAASRLSEDPISIDHIVVKRGGSERVLYKARPGDMEFGEPVVSRDGSRLAFMKTEQLAGKSSTFRVYIMKIDETEPRKVVELRDFGHPIRGARIGATPVAWNHDNRTLAMFATLATDRTPTTIDLKNLPDRGPVDTSNETSTLVLVDTDSGDTRFLRRLGRRVPKSGIWGRVITTQAWAPDGRRLVYMNDDGRVRILDTHSDAEEDIGRGEEPTWSPDGNSIVYKQPERRVGVGKATDGDYVLVKLGRPNEVRVLLPNPRPFWRSRTESDFWVAGYFGPAIWFPDSRHLVVRHAKGEWGEPYILDSKSGAVSKMPKGPWGRSWGGEP